MFGLIKRKRKRKPAKKRKPGPRTRELTEGEMGQLLAAAKAYRAARPDGPPLAITIAGRTDGAGAQALGVLSAMLWARGTGARYLHTPFSRMAHAVGTRQEWAERWEAFLNLGRGETHVPPNATIIPAEDFLRDPELAAMPRLVVATRSLHWKEFQEPNALHDLRPALRRRYRASRKSGLVVHRGPPGAATVAVHIRRGDIILDHPRRRCFYTQDEPILNTIEGVRAVLGALGRDVQINVFSEGPPEMFAAFAAAGCRLHLDGNAFEAFHNLVQADILIQAKSSFSYVAGLISTGAVLHERYAGYGGGTFYRHAPGWILRDDAGAFDAEELRRLLVAAKPDQGRTVSWFAHPLQVARRWF